MDDDLPSCIRREIGRLRAEDERIGFDAADPECREALAFRRWSKQLTNEQLSDAIIKVMEKFVRERTCLWASLAEAAKRLRQNHVAT